ncbi:hypothetical protein MKX01_040462 [Papaver californicum]|nr:hypothetical protein MKX01_040462 [Papaver californicum]
MEKILMRTLTLCFCLILFLSLISMVSSESSSKPSAYEMLESFNFPKGILPEGVKDYVLHEDRRFEVNLGKECKFQVEENGYYLHYQKKITGSVEFGSLKNLKGVSVKIMFIWVGISEVFNKGNGDLEFFVGPVSASFPVSNFDEKPECGASHLNNNQLVSDS